MDSIQLRLRKLRALTPAKVTLPAILFMGLVTALSATLAASLFVATRQAWLQVLRPVLYLDDWPYTHRPYLFQVGDLLRWLAAQHAEHRKIPTRVLSVIETEVFRLPILSLSGLQTLLLMLLSSGLIAWIVHLIIPRRRDALLAWLSCSVIIFNPWQFAAYNLSGLNDIFPVNSSVLAATLMLLGFRKSGSGAWERSCLYGMAILPWLSIFTAGQGFAMAAALVLTALCVSRRMALVAFISSSIAVFFFRKVLPFAESAHRSYYGFDSDFLFSLLTGSSWPGLGLITIFVLILLLADRDGLNDRGMDLDGRAGVILAMPGLFALIYSLLVTISRSGYGLSGASPSWYLISLSMLPVSVVLLASWVYASRATRNESQPFHAARLTIFLPHLIVVLTTVCSFPQLFTGQGVPFRQALGQVSFRRFQFEQSMKCVASNIRKGVTEHHPVEQSSCPIYDPAASEAYKYLRGKKPLKPSGWHLRLTQNGD